MIRRRRLVLPTVMCAVMALGATGAVLGHRSWRHHQTVEGAENQHRADLDRQREARVREAAAVEASRKQAVLEALRREKDNTCYMRDLKANHHFAEA